MAALLFVTALTAVAARYEGDRLLQRYFQEDALWDTINSNDRFSQKCMNDGHWSKLCMCSYSDTAAFACDHDVGYRQFVRTSAHFEQFGDNDYYYFPGTNAAPNNYELPPPITGARLQGNFWRPPPGVVAGTKPGEMTKRHVIPYNVLRDFYNAVLTLPVNDAKEILEPVFDKMQVMLANILADPDSAAWRVDEKKIDRYRALNDFISGNIAGADGRALSTAGSEFKILFTWAPGNLWWGEYVNGDQFDPPPDRPDGTPYWSPAKTANLKEAYDAMELFIADRSDVAHGRVPATNAGGLKVTAANAMKLFLTEAFEGPIPEP